MNNEISKQEVPDNLINIFKQAINCKDLLENKDSSDQKQQEELLTAYSKLENIIIEISKLCDTEEEKWFVETALNLNDCNKQDTQEPVKFIENLTEQISTLLDRLKSEEYQKQKEAIKAVRDDNKKITDVLFNLYNSFLALLREDMKRSNEYLEKAKKSADKKLSPEITDDKPKKTLDPNAAKKIIELLEADIKNSNIKKAIAKLLSAINNGQY